ncbi:glycosyltransferase [Halegenticoccus tardaugens]|uniref:glycosyltransferase n=1 Tax=Halegenticoccus tardaugens TaxID=2071624 RepID=UPI00100BD117|nr:glycosyltransferase [Halegenticoccus tardaugens]
MHVGFVSMIASPARERSVRRTRRVAEALSARGHEATVLCARWWDGDDPEFEREDVVYRAVTGTPSKRSFASKLPFALRKVRPDVIQAVNSPPSHVVAAGAAGRLLRTPLVVDWWRDVANDPSRGYRRAARSADAVVAPSETVKTRVREHGASEGDVRVIPESIDLSLVRDVPVDNRADVVYARDLDEDANVESFLLALAELRDRDWRATVVGDGSERDRAERTARDLRIDDRVEFLGDLPPEERVPILKGAHAFAQTATREPFPTDLLRALACGCVGIVEYQAGSSAHELVEGCERGRLVTNPQELADELIAAAAVERATTNDAFEAFDRESVLERYLDCYRDALDGYGFL